MDEKVRMAIETLVQRVTGYGVTSSEICENVWVPQGASGSEIRSYYVRQSGDPMRQPYVVTKNATLLERSVLAFLAGHNAAVPPHEMVDAQSPDRSVVVMMDAYRQSEHHGVSHPETRQNAQALADIHAKTLRWPPGFVPVAKPGNLYLDAWRTAWDANLELADFRKEFDRYTPRLGSQFDRFCQALASLQSEERYLCLVNGDLHPDHFRIYAARPCFIDWEQARIAPFYLDLVNYFSKETVLAYRDALAEWNHDIPVVDFLDRFHAMGRYMGFRYLSVGLKAWRDRPADWEAKRWFLYYCLELALNGR